MRASVRAGARTVPTCARFISRWRTLTQSPANPSTGGALAGAARLRRCAAPTVYTVMKW
jgi:hypothetical protein